MQRHALDPVENRPGLPSGVRASQITRSKRTQQLANPAPPPPLSNPIASLIHILIRIHILLPNYNYNCNLQPSPQPTPRPSPPPSPYTSIIRTTTICIDTIIALSITLSSPRYIDLWTVHPSLPALP